MSEEKIEITSCDITDKGKSCCSSQKTEKNIDIKSHWDQAYSTSPEDQLGWYETDLSPTLKLIQKTHLEKTSIIFNAGAGSTTLIDELLNEGYSNLIASDISEVALLKLDERVGTDRLQLIQDDLTNPVALLSMEPVDLWIDRAVLHFFMEEEAQNNYFKLIQDKVKNKGFVILAEFNLEGATKCSGLDVFRYSAEMLGKKLGDQFSLIDAFNYTYVMPSGGERPYVYTLFQKH